MFNLCRKSVTRRRAVRSVFALFLSVVALASTISAQAAPPAVGDKAPDFTLNNPKDHPVTLASQLKKGPVVLVLLRGFPGYQCPFCTLQVGAFLSRTKEFEKAKAQVVLVYPGPPEN